MSNSFFIDKKLKRELEKDLKKRNSIEEKIKKLQEDLQILNKKIDNDVETFYEQVDDSTIYSIIDHYNNKSGKNKQKLVQEIEQRYIDKNLIIEDTLSLTDWYENMCDSHNDKI